MTKLTVFLFLLIPTLCWGQTKAEDYWVYIKDRTEIVSSDRIAGTSQKGDIVEVIPCKRLGNNEPSELEKKEWLIIKVSGITEKERNAMLAPYTETNIIDGRPVISTLAYRRRKIDVDAYKTAQSIDSKTSFVTTAVSKTAVVTTEKTDTDISDMQREARLYDRLMPVRKLAKWGWEKILSSAYAANTTHTVITTGGGDYTTLNAYEDAIDGTAYSAGETATVNCSGTDADTTAVTFDGWDSDVTLIISGDAHTGKWNTNYYRLEIGNNSQAILCTSNNIRMYNLQVWAKYNSGGIKLSSYCYVSNTIVHIGDAAGNPGIDGIFIGGTYNKIWNSFVWGRFDYGAVRINVGGDATGTSIYSCTLYDRGSTARGINNASNSAGVTVKNTIVNGFADNYYQSMTTSYCCSDVAGDLSGTGDRNGSDGDVTFVDPDNATFVSTDLHLNSTDVNAINLGTDTSGEGSPLNFTTDIDGKTRSGTWDIGADEYVASGSPTPRRRIIIISKNETNHTTGNTDTDIGMAALCPRRKVKAFA